MLVLTVAYNDVITIEHLGETLTLQITDHPTKREKCKAAFNGPLSFQIVRSDAKTKSPSIKRLEAEPPEGH